MSKEDKALLLDFDILCKQMGVVSRGFDWHKITAPIDGEAHDGTVQWAMKKHAVLGWQIVCGAGGCGVALGGGVSHIKKKKNFLAAIQVATDAARKSREAIERPLPGDGK